MIGSTILHTLKVLPYLYKFSRDVYFADATNSAFLRFYFRGSQDFVLVDYAHLNFRGLNFCEPHVIRENSEIYVPRKFVLVQYLFSKQVNGRQRDGFSSVGAQTGTIKLVMAGT